MKGRGAEIVDSFFTRLAPGYDIYEDWDQETTYPDEVLLEFLTANPEAQADIFHKGTAEAGNPPVPGTKFDEVLKLVKNLGKDDSAQFDAHLSKILRSPGLRDAKGSSHRYG